MKTLFVFNHPAPYKVHVFNELAKLTDIRVIFEREKAKDRPDSFYADNEYNFPVIFLKNKGFGKENTATNELRNYIKKHRNLYDVIVMNGYSTIAEMKAIRYMIRHHIPYVLQINGGIIKKDNALKKQMKTYFISNAYKWFSPCKDADEYLIHYGANKKMIFDYPYGNVFDKEVISKPVASETKTKLRKKYNLPEGPLFVSAAQFIKRKNNMQLLSLFKDRKETLVLIGEGEEKDKYLEYIEKHNIKNIIVMDYMKKADLFEVFKSADYFITLSKEDIFGHTTIEAMANGLPVISSDRVVASRDLIINGENGFLVDINSEQEVKEALDKANTLNANKAIKTAKKNTIECSAKRLHDLLRG